MSWGKLLSSLPLTPSSTEMVLSCALNTHLMTTHQHRSALTYYLSLAQWLQDVSHLTGATLIEVSIDLQWNEKNEGNIDSFSQNQIYSVQSLSCVRIFGTPWTSARQASLSIPNSWSSFKLTFIKLVMPSSHLILCRPLLLPPIPPSIRVFSNASALHMRWPKYWSFSFSFSPSKKHPDLL